MAFLSSRCTPEGARLALRRDGVPSGDLCGHATDWTGRGSRGACPHQCVAGKIGGLWDASGMVGDS